MNVGRIKYKLYYHCKYYIFKKTVDMMMDIKIYLILNNLLNLGDLINVSHKLNYMHNRYTVSF